MPIGFDAARDWFQRAIAAQRDHAGAINNLGVLYAKIGQARTIRSRRSDTASRWRPTMRRCT